MEPIPIPRKPAEKRKPKPLGPIWSPWTFGIVVGIVSWAIEVLSGPAEMIFPIVMIASFAAIAAANLYGWLVVRHQRQPDKPGEQQTPPPTTPAPAPPEPN
jgi:hypothetical protein